MFSTVFDYLFVAGNLHVAVTRPIPEPDTLARPDPAVAKARAASVDTKEFGVYRRMPR